MTERLFFTHDHLTAELEVLSCTAHEEQFALTLQSTIFHPQGGGQPVSNGWPPPWAWKIVDCSVTANCSSWAVQLSTSSSAVRWSWVKNRRSVIVYIRIKVLRAV